MTMLLSLGAIALGFWLLMWSADQFVDGAAAIAHNFGIPPMIIGLTVVGFATSAPEMLISVLAAFENQGGIAIGNAIGSNIVNTGFILGLAAFLYPLTIRQSMLRTEVLWLFIAMALCFWLMSDGILSRTESALLLLLMVLLLVALVIKSRHDSPTDAPPPTVIPTARALGLLVLGLLVLLISAKLLVWGAVNTAKIIGISDLIIGLTVVALGTSLPELAATLSAAKKNQPDLAVGNIIGSNLFNILAVVGAAGAIKPLPISPEVLWRDMLAMVVIHIVLVGSCLFFKSGRDFIAHKTTGSLLMLGYVIYLGILAYDSI